MSTTNSSHQQLINIPLALHSHAVPPMLPVHQCHLFQTLWLHEQLSKPITRNLKAISIQPIVLTIFICLCLPWPSGCLFSVEWRMCLTYIHFWKKNKKGLLFIFNTLFPLQMLFTTCCNKSVFQLISQCPFLFIYCQNGGWLRLLDKLCPVERRQETGLS